MPNARFLATGVGQELGNIGLLHTKVRSSFVTIVVLKCIFAGESVRKRNLRPHLAFARLTLQTATMIALAGTAAAQDKPPRSHSFTPASVFVECPGGVAHGLTEAILRDDALFTVGSKETGTDYKIQCLDVSGAEGSEEVKGQVSAGREVIGVFEGRANHAADRAKLLMLRHKLVRGQRFRPIGVAVAVALPPIGEPSGELDESMTQALERLSAARETIANELKRRVMQELLHGSATKGVFRVLEEQAGMEYGVQIENVRFPGPPFELGYTAVYVVGRLQREGVDVAVVRAMGGAKLDQTTAELYLQSPWLIANHHELMSQLGDEMAVDAALTILRDKLASIRSVGGTGK